MREEVAALGWLALAGVIAMLACASREPAESGAGSLEVEWTGSDTGKLSAPAVAEWCDSLRMMELRAIHGDTGIALVLYPTDSVAPGRYPVTSPERADSSRPSAAVAMRWFAETSIRGFRGDSGTVTLDSIGAGRFAGRFSAQVRSATEGSKLMVTGSFKGLSVTSAAQSCAGPAAPQRPDEPDEPLDELDEPDRSAESAD